VLFLWIGLVKCFVHNPYTSIRSIQKYHYIAENQLQGFSTAQPKKRCNKVDVFAAAKIASTPEKDSLSHRLKIGGLFGLWYALNIGYNIYNKKVLNMVPSLTYTVALLQLVIGLVYILPVWALKIRPAPELTIKEILSLIPIAVLHSLTHLGAVVSLSAGAVSFTHIVKAAEPAVSAVLSAIFTRSFLPLPVYASLIVSNLEILHIIFIYVFTTKCHCFL
jgi:drug/metabolite transporter (DMT)-like permease